MLLTATMMLDSKKTLKERITLIAESPKTARYARIACIWAVVIAAVCTFTGAAPIVTPIDVTLEAVKLDADGNELGIYSIHIQGNQFDYLLDQDRLDVTISSFDNLESVMAATYIHKYGETVGAITKSQWEDYFRVSYGAWNTTTDDMVFASLCFSEDLDRWVFSNDSDKFYYVASVSGAYSAMELAEYFQYITPASRFETEEAHD